MHQMCTRRANKVSQKLDPGQLDLFGNLDSLGKDEASDADEAGTFNRSLALPKSQSNPL
mgnify:CR=1 FL=1